ncbi:hypothetical protein QJS04_geneDACA021438 [Acorus gramineus]|uniref:DUF4283 domain-containing protein n=1 Tax=Acorus gramineus TaxID=55184 RepID=A0AAV9B7H5_ACOGR|nr:hypothetical protein QJS04_geneDACA021438 [Acorus gramineus]
MASPFDLPPPPPLPPPLNPPCAPQVRPERNPPPPKCSRFLPKFAPAVVGQQVSSWKSLFTNPSSSLSNERSLSFIPPRVDDKESIVVLNPVSFKPLIQHWENVIVGYIIGKSPVYTPFLQFLKKKWKPKADFQLFLHGNGFFTIKFDLEEDCNFVLEGGPWTMEHRPFILRKWSPELRMEQERLSSIPIWVRFPNLPLNLWNLDCLSRIGSLIGTPLVYGHYHPMM